MQAQIGLQCGCFVVGVITSPQGYRLNAWALIKECKTILYVHGNNWLVFAISLPGIELIQFKVSTTTLVAAIRMNIHGVARFACGWKVHTTCMIAVKKDLGLDPRPLLLLQMYCIAYDINSKSICTSTAMITVPTARPTHPKLYHLCVFLTVHSLGVSGVILAFLLDLCSPFNR